MDYTQDPDLKDAMLKRHGDASVLNQAPTEAPVEPQIVTPDAVHPATPIMEAIAEVIKKAGQHAFGNKVS